jgi:hypothetical protein
VSRAALLTALALLCVALAGCGYRLAAGDLRALGRVAIVTPSNDAGEPGFERVVADALRRELLRRGGGRLAEDPAAAELVVRGRILKVETAARSLSSVVLAFEYETRVTLELRALRGEEIVEVARLEETERHLASADVEASRKNRDEAMRRVASVLAARFLDRVGDVAVQ